ncbi:helix-turn-helix domain-containing protein [Paenibacillus sp. TAB 01]|uniref:helix-turn-helix domain-containing protein n=1 Tax=Paenibacillus sp. TAB 01 TaxID=3368988 RepID=UPI003750282F
MQSYLYAIASEFMAVLEKPKVTDDDLTDYVTQIKQSILEHCSAQLDIEEVALLSGSSYTRFYQVFKKHTGLSPLKFLTNTRLNESLRLLANAPASIMEVAHSVGYSDELYFSRLFKKHMGLSPTEYAACAKTRVANLCPVFRGDLAVLGLTPVLELQREWFSDPHKDKYYQRIEQSRPGIIFTSPVADEVYNTLSQIAPVVMIKWKGYSWKERLLQISRRLQIPTVAEWWLAYFQMKVEHARGHLREHLGDEPFLVVSAFEPFYRVYGLQRIKMKDLFYDELQVKAPASAEQITFLDVQSLAEVASLDCNNILILAPDSVSDEDCIQMEEEWLQLKRSRQQKRCIFIRHEEPLLYNASFYERLMNQFVDQLIG